MDYKPSSPGSDKASVGIIFLLFLASSIMNWIVGPDIWLWPYLLIPIGGILGAIGVALRAWTRSAGIGGNSPLTLEMYMRMLDAIHDAVVITDFRGRILFCNQAFVDVSGYSADEIVGKEALSLAVRPDLYSLEEEAKWAAESGNQERVWKLKHKDGRPIEITGKANVLTDPETGQQYGFSIMRDISLQVESKAALEREKKQFEFFVESLPHLMWAFDTKGKVDFLNRVGRELLQTDGVEGPDSSQWYNYLHPEDLNNVSFGYYRLFIKGLCKKEGQK